MNSTEIFNLIEQIAATSSRNEKEALLKTGIGDQHLMDVLLYTYSPFKQYQFGSIKLTQLLQSQEEKETPSSGVDFDEATWQLLDALCSRTLSGEAAFSATYAQMQHLNPSSAALLWRILKKDLRAGFTDGTVNKVFKGLIPEFPYMRCSLPDKSSMAGWDWSQGHISQEKADGMFVNVCVDSGVTMYTRQGTPIPELYELKAECRETFSEGTQLHGEMVVMRDGQVLTREIGNGILNSVCKGGSSLLPGDVVMLYVWDQIPLASALPKGKVKTPYGKRLAGMLYEIAKSRPKLIRPVSTRVVKSYADAMSHYAEMLAQGKEGTVLKHADAIWKDGTSKDQVKLKLEIDVDLVVTDIEDGNPGSKNAGRPGALVCETACSNLVVRVAIKNEAMRDAVEANRLDWFNRIVQVRANSVMTPQVSGSAHSLFLPRLVFDTYRIDKSEPDTLEQVKDQFNSAMKGEK